MSHFGVLFCKALTGSVWFSQTWHQSSNVRLWTWQEQPGVSSTRYLVTPATAGRMFSNICIITLTSVSRRWVLSLVINIMATPASVLWSLWNSIIPVLLLILLKLRLLFGLCRLGVFRSYRTKWQIMCWTKFINTVMTSACVEGGSQWTNGAESGRERVVKTL